MTHRTKLLVAILIVAGSAKPQGGGNPGSVQQSVDLTCLQCAKPPKAELSYNFKPEDKVPFGDIIVKNEGTGQILEPSEITISCPRAGKTKPEVFHARWDKKIPEGAESVPSTLPGHLPEDLKWAECKVTSPPLPTTPSAVKEAGPPPKEYFWKCDAKFGKLQFEIEKGSLSSGATVHALVKNPDDGQPWYFDSHLSGTRADPFQPQNRLLSQNSSTRWTFSVLITDGPADMVLQPLDSPACDGQPHSTEETKPKVGSKQSNVVGVDWHWVPDQETGLSKIKLTGVAGPKLITLNSGQLKLLAVTTVRLQNANGTWTDDRTEPPHVSDGQAVIPVPWTEVRRSVTASTMWTGSKEPAERYFCLDNLAQQAQYRTDTAQTGRDCTQDGKQVRATVTVRGSPYEQSDYYGTTRAPLSFTMEGPRSDYPRLSYPAAANVPEYTTADLPKSLRVEGKIFETKSWQVDPSGQAQVDLSPVPSEVVLHFKDSVTKQPIDEISGYLWLQTGDGARTFNREELASGRSRAPGDRTFPLPRLPGDRMDVVASATGYEQYSMRPYKPDDSWKVAGPIALNIEMIPLPPPVRTCLRPFYEVPAESSAGKTKRYLNANDVDVVVSTRGGPNYVAVFDGKDSYCVPLVQLPMGSNVTVGFKPQHLSEESRVLAKRTAAPAEEINKAKGEIAMQISKPILTVLINPSNHFGLRTKDPRHLEAIKNQAWRVFDDLSENSKYGSYLSFRYFGMITDPSQIQIKVRNDSDSGVDTGIRSDDSRMETLREITFGKNNLEVYFGDAAEQFRKYLNNFSQISSEYRGVLVYVTAEESDPKGEEADRQVVDSLKKEKILALIVRLGFTAAQPRIQPEGNLHLFDFGMPTEGPSYFVGAFQTVIDDIKKGLRIP